MTQPTIVDAHVHLWDPARHPWYPGLHAFAEHAASPGLLERHLENPIDHFVSETAGIVGEPHP